MKFDMSSRRVRPDETETDLIILRLPSYVHLLHSLVILHVGIHYNGISRNNYNNTCLFSVTNGIFRTRSQ